MPFGRAAESARHRRAGAMLPAAPYRLASSVVTNWCRPLCATTARLTSEGMSAHAADASDCGLPYRGKPA